MAEAMEALKERLALIDGLQQAYALMGWDQETYMPEGGSISRARALGSLSHVIHEMSTSAEFGRLLEAAEQESEALSSPPDSDEARLLWWLRRDFERANKLPPAFVAELEETTSLANSVWAAARRDNDFERFAPHLEAVVRLQRRMVEYIGYDEHPYDALLDLFEPEMKMAEVTRIFDELRGPTVELVRAIAAQPQVEDTFLHQHFPASEQWELARDVPAYVGYDYEHGRMDASAHPFCSTIGHGDVRLTVRLDESFFNPLFYAALHEAGHGLYSQGQPARLAGTPLHRGASAAIHESQSRLWENIVGRGRPFLKGYYPKVQARFPEQLGEVGLEAFYRAVNRVEPGMIRVESDEVTYNLHIMLRYDLEIALLEGSVEVEALPARWNEKMEAYLGIVPPSDAEGVLQDMHWALGLYGYFPTYTIGNIISVQLYDAARESIPHLEQEIEKGEMKVLLGWMREQVHEHGRKFLPEELLLRVTGRRMDARPYVRYLHEKYRDIYALPA